MKKTQKTEIVKEIASQVDSCDAIFAVDYRGLSVPGAAELRARLRDAETTFRIVKNSLTLQAADKSSSERAEQLKALVQEGPTALAFIKGDPALAAKVLDGFAREADVLAFKGGMLGVEPLSADDIKRLARLPGRAQLNAALAGVVASPLTGLVRGLGSMLSGLAVALGRVMEQKGKEPQPERANGTDRRQPAHDADGQTKQNDSEEETQEQEAGH